MPRKRGSYARGVRSRLGGLEQRQARTERVGGSADRRTRATATAKAGPVTVRRPDGSTEVRPPYTPKQAQEIAKGSRAMVT